MNEIAFLAVHPLHSCETAHTMLSDEDDDSLLGDDWFIVLFPEKWLGVGQSFVSRERGNRFKPAIRQLKKNKRKGEGRNET